MPTLIGTKWKHKKRGSTYQVIGVVGADLTGLKDMDEAFFWEALDAPKHVMGISKDIPGRDQGVLILAIPIRLQIEVPRPHVEIIVLYQADEDGSIWSGPEDEFLDGRFERLIR